MYEIHAMIRRIIHLYVENPLIGEVLRGGGGRDFSLKEVANREIIK